MSNSKNTWPPLTDSQCQAINGYGAPCTHTVSQRIILCPGQMRGFCGFHMNMSFTLAGILKLVAQDLRDDKQPDLADAMLRKYGVHPDERQIPLDDDDYVSPPGCTNCHSAMIFHSAGIEGTLYRCTGCPARIRVS